MSRRLRYRRAIRDALAEEMTRDDRVMLIGEDLREPWGGTFKATQGLSTEFGDERVLNTPIAENGIVGAALGAALAGLRPVVELMYVDFALLAGDQIINQAAKIGYMTGGQVSVPLVVRTQGGGYRSSGAQHSQSLEAIFAHIPGLLVAMPSTPADAKGLLKTAIRIDAPVVFIEHKDLYLEAAEVPDGEHLVPFGEAVVRRAGTEVTIVSWSAGVRLALAAAESLSDEGIDCEVIDLRTLVPLDAATVLESVKRTRRAVVVHEACVRGGFGGELVALIQERLWDHLEAPVLRVGSRDVPIPMAPNLERLVLPSLETVADAVRRSVATPARPRPAGSAKWT